MPAYNMQDAEAAQERADFAHFYSRRAALHSETARKKASELRHRSDEARDCLTGTRKTAESLKDQRWRPSA